MQKTWIELQSIIKEYQNQQLIEYYDKKIVSIESQLKNYQTHLFNVKKQAEFAHNELESFKKQYQRDLLLLKKAVISESEFDNSKLV